MVQQGKNVSSESYYGVGSSKLGKRPGAGPLDSGSFSKSKAGKQEVVIQTRSLCKLYDLGSVQVAALRGVDMKVLRGEFVAVMGPSGSGKSTLLHLMGGLDRPTSGEVFLGKKPLSRLTDDELSIIRRRKMGFIFQSYNLLPTLTAEENVFLPLMADGRDPERFRRQFEDLMHLVMLTDRLDHKPDQLSGGQQQRVAIARAFITEPEVILADEPTGNLDSKAGTIILDLLRRVCGGMKATIVMVTHDPRAASFAHRVVFLKDGDIVDQCMNVQDGKDVSRIAQRLAYLEEE